MKSKFIPNTSLGINITKITGIKSGSRDRIRELIRIRDNHTCQLCGKKWEGGKKLDVHHKDCDKEKSRQSDNYEKEKNNMITLCHKCHLNLPAHKKTMRLSYRKALAVEIVTQIIKMLEEGVAGIIIAKKFGVTPQSVQRHKNKLKSA